jgi:NADH-quinone oxidoreductase subunit K
MIDMNFVIFSAIVLLLIIGLYCLIATRNLIRILIGLEVLTKAVTLLLVAAGYLTSWVSVTQSFVITLIIIEVVIVVVAFGIVIGVVTHNKNLDTWNLRKLKG